MGKDSKLRALSPQTFAGADAKLCVGVCKALRSALVRRNALCPVIGGCWLSKTKIHVISHIGLFLILDCSVTKHHCLTYEN